MPYTVEGYPGLALLDEQHHIIDAQVIAKPDPIGAGTVTAAAPLTLASGQRAHAVLIWRNTVELGRDVTPGSYLVVTPSPRKDQQLVTLNMDLGTTGRSP